MLQADVLRKEDDDGWTGAFTASVTAGFDLTSQLGIFAEVVGTAPLDGRRGGVSERRYSSFPSTTTGGSTRESMPESTARQRTSGCSRAPRFDSSTVRAPHTRDEQSPRRDYPADAAGRPCGEPAPPALEVHDLTVAYDRKAVLYGIDATVPQGSLCGIIGPNGAGKSTLIKAIMGLLPVQGGWTQVFGGRWTNAASASAYVPQRSRWTGISRSM